MTKQERWKQYIRDLNEEDQDNLFLALTKIRDDFHKFRSSNHSNFLRRTEGRCSIELNFNDGTTRICFNSAAISNKDLYRHSQIMRSKDWEEYLNNLGEQDRQDLFSVLAIMQGDFHMHRGKSPSHLPSFLYKTKGRCRTVLKFKTGLTEFSFNSLIISNSEIDGLLNGLEEVLMTSRENEASTL